MTKQNKSYHKGKTKNSLFLSFSLQSLSFLSLPKTNSLSPSPSLYSLFLAGAAGEGTGDAVGEKAKVEEAPPAPPVAVAEEGFAPSAEGAKQAAAAAPGDPPPAPYTPAPPLALSGLSPHLREELPFPAAP